MTDLTRYPKDLPSKHTEKSPVAENRLDAVHRSVVPKHG
jgi:hypothetical protein